MVGISIALFIFQRLGRLSVANGYHIFSAFTTRGDGCNRGMGIAYDIFLIVVPLLSAQRDGSAGQTRA